MRAVKADVTSSKPISLSKAEAALSLFAASETGARPDVAAYLRCAMTAFKELVDVHREIRYQRKISQEGEDELVEEEDNSRRQKKKKNKERGSEAESNDGNLILEKQGLGVLFNKSLGIASMEAKGGVQEKKTKEKEMRRIAGAVIESYGIVENKKEKEKKREVKLERKVEMKSKEVEYDEKRSEERKKLKKNKKREGRLLEGGRVGLFFDESIASERKKRKHSDIEQGGMDGEMKPHEGKGKKKRRKAE